MKFLRRSLMLVLCLALVACSQSVERGLRTTELVQDNINSITNNLNEIQRLENAIQTDFETTLRQGDQDLSVFNKSDNPIMTNVANRNKLLDQLQKASDTIEELNEEMVSQLEKSDIPKDQTKEIVELVAAMKQDLNVYTSDYKKNLELEKQTYQSIANPDTNYDNFFGVFNNIDVIMTNNQMNLEKVLGYFEKINAHLIDFKVYLTNLKESHS